MRMDIKNTSVTRTESITLVKNLFRAAFSSIAYLRNFFHEDVSHLLSYNTLPQISSSVSALPLAS